MNKAFIKDKHLEFLCTQIQQLQTAIFTDFSLSLFRFPADLIEISNIDSEGNLWFTTQPLFSSVDCSEKTFSAQLHFYNRNYNYHLSAYGTASIVTDEAKEHLVSLPLVKRDNHNVVIKFKILNAEYFFRKSNNNYLKTFIDNMMSKFLANDEPVLYRF